MKYKAVIFDVDGVFTGVNSIWKYIHEHLNTWNQAQKNRRLFFEGKITYEEWAKRDVSLWKSVDISVINDIVREIPLRRCAEDLTFFLKRMGLKIFAISAGVDLLVEKLSKKLGFDEYITNKIIVCEEKITGDIKVLVNFENKGKLAIKLLKKHGIDPSETITVGDDEVDLPLFEISGFSIAFNTNSTKLLQAVNAVVISESLCILKDLLSVILI